jgi:protein HIRA/HIR1
VPTVAALDRTRDFAIARCYMGPFSSINCIRFNPQLYRLNIPVGKDNPATKTVIAVVFAMGDNDGNV